MTVVKKEKQQDPFKKFNQIDGSHPFKKILPQGYIDYPARIRRGGKVGYFNFDLARSMGLIPKAYPNQIDQELEKIIYDTFSIQIINEFDQMNGRKFKEEDMKSGTYMATRYLQLQHDDKKGLSSGDGRSVWLGQVKHQGKAWDISACGTGATRLSPATSKFNKFFETGDPSISYGCGYGELDEGIATALMSEVFSHNNIATERTLCIIEFKNNISINVRVHENLLRPSHFFLYLKQDDLDSLKAVTDFYIKRQVDAKYWDIDLSNKRKYDYLLDKVNEKFAHISADFEDEYIFCWLDWDGDNILMDGGIIDYGSIRQFGMLHHEYRYDDDDRYSTCILEQKTKAKYMVQTFIQAIDYLKTGEKKKLGSFSDHKILRKFEDLYEQRKNRNILNKIGLTDKKAKQFLKRNKNNVEEFRKVFSYFEKTKVKSGIVKIPDGKTCDAVFNMRTFLRDYPQVLLVDKSKVSDDDFIELLKSRYAKAEDLEINSYRKQKIQEIQDLYIDMIESIAGLFQESSDDTLMSIITRGQIINKPNRITGDAVTYIVDIINSKSKNLKPEQIYSLIQDLVLNQSIDPDIKSNYLHKRPPKILQQILEVIKENREGI